MADMGLCLSFCAITHLDLTHGIQTYFDTLALAAVTIQSTNRTLSTFLIHVCRSALSVFFSISPSAPYKPSVNLITYYTLLSRSIVNSFFVARVSGRLGYFSNPGNSHERAVSNFSTTTNDLRNLALSPYEQEIVHRQGRALYGTRFDNTGCRQRNNPPTHSLTRTAWGQRPKLTKLTKISPAFCFSLWRLLED